MTRTITVTMLLFATVSLLMSQQNQPSSRSEPSAVEPFIGAWKFNPKKSSQSGIERESINIELRDGAYKFTYDSLADNGTELNWWFVTDMKEGA